MMITLKKSTHDEGGGECEKMLKHSLHDDFKQVLVIRTSSWNRKTLNSFRGSLSFNNFPIPFFLMTNYNGKVIRLLALSAQSFSTKLMDLGNSQITR